MPRLKTDLVEKRFKELSTESLDDKLFETPTKAKTHDQTRRLRTARYIPIALIKPDPKQPRQDISDDSLTELTNSIKERGVLQPISVTEDTKTDNYIIVVGERRYLAAQQAGLTELPCIIRDRLDKADRLTEQLIENIQREDLSPIDKAWGLLKLKKNLGKDVQWKEVEARTGIGTRRRQQFLALLDLPELIQKDLVSLGTKRIKNQITEGHARALLKLKKNRQKQLELYQQIKNSKDPVSSQEAMRLARNLLETTVAPRAQRLVIVYSSKEDLLARLQEKIKELKRDLASQ